MAVVAQSSHQGELRPWMPFGLPVEGIEFGTADVLGAGEAVAPEALGVDLQTYVR